MIYLNGTYIAPTLFPDNTTQIWKLPTFNTLTSARVLWEFDNESEFLHIAQLKSLLDTITEDITLHIDYLPYGRQDKEVSNESTFGLRPFAKLLNSLNFKEITILDPHSLVAIHLIENSKAIYPIKEIQLVSSLTEAEVVCYPDKGAVTKYKEMYNMKYIYGNKARSQSTGDIFSYELVGDCKNKNVLIVDDICDGGMTFKLLSKALFSKGANEVDMFVTHGIFSKGLAPLKESGIRKIFTNKGEVHEVQNNITYRRI